MARTELGKDSSVMPVKGQLRGVNFRRDKSKNRIRGRRLDSFLDSRGVELGDGFLIIRRGKNTICKERLYFREKFGLEGEFFITRPKGGGGICMGGVVTFAWEGWVGRRAEAKYCLQRRERWSLMGRTLDSWKR